MNNQIKKKDPILLIIISCLVYLYIFRVFGHHGGDNFAFLYTFNEKISLDRFWFLLTESKTHGYQYRPLGFFGFYYLLGSFFSVNVWGYKIINAALMIVNSYLVYSISFKFVAKRDLALISSFIFLSSYGFQPQQIDLSLIAKYGFVTTLFLFLYKYHIQNNSLGNMVLFLCSAIMIMLHEGVVGIILVLSLMSVVLLKNYISALVLIFPLGLYSVMRIFVWEVPSSGFMAIGVDRVLLYFLYSGAASFSSMVSLDNYVILFFVLFVPIIYWLIKKKDKTLFFLFTMTLFSYLPFCFLREHTITDVTIKSPIWSASFASILVVALFKDLKRKKVLFGLIFWTNVFGSYQFHQKVLIPKYKWFDSIVERTKRSFDKVVLGNTSKKIYINLNDNDKIKPVEKIYNRVFLPGVLSYLYPDHSFILKYPDYQNLSKTSFTHINIEKKSLPKYILNEGEILKVFDEYGYIYDVKNIDIKLNGEYSELNFITSKEIIN